MSARCTNFVYFSCEFFAESRAKLRAKYLTLFRPRQKALFRLNFVTKQNVAMKSVFSLLIARNYDLERPKITLRELIDLVVM